MEQAKRVTAVLDVHPMLRASEKVRVEVVLARRPGVERVEANPVAQTATVTYDPSKTSLAELRHLVEECGYHCAGQSVPEHLCDPEMEPDPPHAAHGAAAQAVAVQPAPTAGEHATHAAPAAPGETLRAPQEVMGHGGHGAMSMAAMVADMRNRFLVAALFSIPIVLWSPIGRDVLGFTAGTPLGLRDDVWALLLSLPVIFYSCWIFFTGAVRALRARTLDMMVLVAVAVGAGWGYSVVITLTGGGEVFYEAATVLASFVLLGHWFEMRARGGANDAIRTLLDLAPPRALVLRDGEPVEVSTAEVQVGDLLLVRPGAKIATDGVVTDGESEVDESVVTGESLPVHKQPGSPVIGATINENGTLRVRATKVGADTALAQIVKLVQEAQNSKAPGQRLADRAAFWLVLVALVGGGLTLVVWLLAGRPFSTAILFAITVVVITCPDALGLATPTAIMVGTGLGAQRGILFKHAVALETAARIDTVVLDKTGTLTKGEPEVTDLVTADGVDQVELLRLAAAVERESEHPLAEAIVRRADQAGIGHAAADGFQNVPGHGALATVEGRRVAVGNRRLLERERVDLGPLGARREELAAGGRTVVLVAVDGRAVGLVGIADAARETAVPAVQALHDTDVEVVMLTGDNRATAERIAGQLGIDQVLAEVLPGDKAAKVAELQQGGRKVAMVGDGVNDAPALAQADLGIAIGAGTDVAIETADVVLMRSDPLDVPVALQIGRGTLRKMRQNLGWAIGYNAIALPIAAGVFEPSFGLVLRPEIAALSMSGSSVIVAVNALALKRLRLPAVEQPQGPTPPMAPRSRQATAAGPDPQGRQPASDPSWLEMASVKGSLGRLAAVLAVVLVLAGCGRAVPPGAPAPSTATTPAAPGPGRVPLGEGSTYVAVATTDVTARSKPGGGRILGLFPKTTPWGSPTPFLVKHAYRNATGETWLQVLLPRRPNELIGWVRRDQVRLRTVGHRLEVDLSARTVRLLRDGRPQRTWPVGIGRAATPTPTGSFYVTVKLRPPQISPVYGAWALGLSGYSEVLEQFGTGDGQIALHGTADPTDLGRQVSNGCVRLDNQAITNLAATVPLGTPVTILA